MTTRFGEQLFQHRRSKKLQQKQLAHAAGIDPSYLAGLENGRRSPPERGTLISILLALELAPEEINRMTALAALERAVRYMQADGEELPGLECVAQLALMLPQLSHREVATIESLLDLLAHRSAREGAM